MDHTWVKEFPGTIIVCDPQGIILEMNQRAIKSYLNLGGERLIGSNLLDCHPPAARERLQGLMERQEANCYTIEKKGHHRFIYQTPWYQDGQYAGFVEMVVTIPADIPHFIREG